MTPLELGFVLIVFVLLGAAGYFAQLFARELTAQRALPPREDRSLGEASREGNREAEAAERAPKSERNAEPELEPEPEPEAKPDAPAAAAEFATQAAARTEAEADTDADAESKVAPEAGEPSTSDAEADAPEAPASKASSAELDDLFNPGAASSMSGAAPVPAASTSGAKAPLLSPPPSTSTASGSSSSLFKPPSASSSGLSVPKVEFPKVEAPVEMPVDKPKVDAGKLAKQDDEDEGARLRRGLLKTRKGFITRLADLFRGKPKVDDDLKDDVEEVLFTADIGAKTAEKLLARVTEVLDRKEVADADAVWEVIKNSVLEIIDLPGDSLDFSPKPPPYVLLMIGVNGVGKTTTLGKLASRHASEGRKVLLVAGDTFRAAAVEQLEVWAKRVGCDIHTGAEGADPSSVIFDGIARARKEGHDVVLCDTAGRLHTRKELMDELQKIRRSTVKALSKGQDAEIEPHDIFLVLDATIGQNALSQAQLFKETMNFSGLVLTKLDGTAKGGVVLGICDELGVPVRYIGIGEGIDDLRDFDPPAFADALLTRPDGDA